MIDDGFFVGSAPPRASRPRRLLAVYLDYLLFGALWALLLWAASRLFPGIARLHPAVKAVVFVLGEGLLLRFARRSPGHALLGIRMAVSRSYLDSGQSSLLSPELVIEPRLLYTERWWTILFGVLAILEGAKGAVRWTMFTPPAPFFGVQTSYGVSALLFLAFGILEILAGVAALRFWRSLLPLAAAAYGLAALSAILSWELWPEWIASSVRSRRAWQGVPVREGEIELLQAIMPALTVAVPAMFVLWAFVIHLRARRSLSAVS
jgi:hypothetical protein